MTARTRVVTVTIDGRSVTVPSTDPARVTNVGPAGTNGTNGTNGDPGPGLAAGGTTGQIAAKASDDDYDTEWVNAPTGGASAAEDVTFTPAGGLAAVDVQAALEELDAEKAATHAHPYEASGAVATHVADTTDAHALAGITGLQAALDGKADDADITALDGRVDALETAPPAHAASHADGGTDEITVAESQVTGLTAALAGKADDADITALDGRLDTIEADNATQTELDAHVNDTGDAHDASAISFSPTGTIAATDVQAAIAEVASEAAGGSTIKDRRWDTSWLGTLIDAFNDASLAAGWVRVDAAGKSANVDVVEAGDVVTMRNNGNGAGTTDASAEYHALLKPLSSHGGALANGDAIVAAIRLHAATQTDLSVIGLCLTDGTTHGAGNQVMFIHYVTSSSSGSTGIRAGTNFTSDGGTDTAPSSRLAGQTMFYRIVRTAANTWRGDISPDGVQWIPGSATISKTITPTHCGFVSSAYGSNNRHIASFDVIGRQSGIS